MTAVYQRPNSGMIVVNDHEYGQVDAARQSSYKSNTVIIYIIYQDSASNNKSKKSHFDSTRLSLRVFTFGHFWCCSGIATSKMINRQSRFSFVFDRAIFRVKS